MTIGISQTESNYEVSQREYETDEPDPSFYVEKSSGFIVEVKLFPEFAFIRLVTPGTNTPVIRMSLIEFAEDFEEFLGDIQEVRSILFGSSASGIKVEKKDD